jgi:hypothetical protein
VHRHVPRYGAPVTVATKVLSVAYPVAGGAGAALTTRALLESARRFVLGSRTPSGRKGGGTALVWTALSWAVSGSVGLYTGRKLVRQSVVVQPAQS